MPDEKIIDNDRFLLLDRGAIVTKKPLRLLLELDRPFLKPREDLRGRRLTTKEELFDLRYSTDDLGNFLRQHSDAWFFIHDEKDPRAVFLGYDGVYGTNRRSTCEGYAVWLRK